MRSLLQGGVTRRFQFNRRSPIWLGAAAVMVATQLQVTAQGPSQPVKQTSTTNQAKTAKAWTAPRTADDRPDLRGIWSNASLTPFERPKELAGKEFFTEEEAARFAKTVLDQSNRDRRGATPEEDVGGAYNEAWFDRGTKVASNLRTSIVVDPADGKVPALTPEAREAAAARAAIQRRPPEGPEDFALPVRCILWPTAGPPMIPSVYNNNYQIIQTRDYVAIEIEMIHDVRIVPLDGRPHISPAIRRWMGDSVGHWEGDTLVVDTTNFTDQTHFRGADRNLHVVERFTRTGAETLQYRFTIDDPTAFTAPWTGEIAMSRASGPIYEYACHEGNYSLANMLSAARTQEKAEAGEASKTRSK
jgi:hypothetical protein